MRNLMNEKGMIDGTHFVGEDGLVFYYVERSKQAS
jgi:hypothetical protein